MDESYVSFKDMKKRIIFIGAGKVAWHLSYALNKKGYVISGIASRKKSSAEKLAGKFAVECTTNPESIVKDADIIFITTPDSEIKKVVTNLCKNGVLRKKQLIIHTSGLMSIKILDCVKKSGALPLSMHPIYSFSSRSLSKDLLSGVWFILEGDSEAIEQGEKIVRMLGGKSFIIEGEKKSLYHLALVFASNFFVGVEDMAVELLLSCGIEKKDVLELIKPLVQVTEKNIWEKGTTGALTGPVERGDIETIKKHLELLSKQKQSFKKTYLELCKHLLKMVEEKGNIEKENIQAMRKMLNDK